MRTRTSDIRVGLISLGCSKNLVDAEVFMGDLARRRFALCQDHEDADVVIVNTCGFIEAAREESREVIRAQVARKRRGECRGVIVAGCMAQRYRDDLRREVPGIDGIIGLSAYPEMARLVRLIYRRRDEALTRVQPTARDTRLDVARLRLTPPHYAYVKISEGCSNRCTFCAIPRIRGRFRSKPREDVVREVQELAASGAREVLLIAEDTTTYGRDLYGRYALADLLGDVSAVPGVRWIRLLYAFPAHLTEDVLCALRDLPNVCRYIDVPIQHVSTPVLERMCREVTGAEVRRLVGRIRETVGGVAIRTTVLSGFPGETLGDHRELVQFVRDYRIDRLGAFAYSPEERTPAFRYPQEPGPEEGARRRDEVLEVQREVAFARSASLVGREVEVLVDARGEDGTLAGRTEHDAPEVDGLVLLSGEAAPGEFRRVRVTGADGYDLVGELESQADLAWAGSTSPTP